MLENFARSFFIRLKLTKNKWGSLTEGKVQIIVYANEDEFDKSKQFVMRQNSKQETGLFYYKSLSNIILYLGQVEVEI